MNVDAARLPAERRYYIAVAAGIIIIVLAGFSIDLPLLPHLDRLSVLVRVHGVVMLTWVTLFFVQVLLVARRRLAWHMRLGIFGAVLAVAVVATALPTLVIACRLGGDHMPPGMPKPLFLALGLSNLFVYSVLVGSALALRRRASGWHKRLMLLAATLLLDAALARFISAYTSWTVDSSTVRNLLMFACIAVDTWRCRRLHPAFVSGGLLVFMNDYVASWTAATPAWLHFIRALLA